MFPTSGGVRSPNGESITSTAAFLNSAEASSSPSSSTSSSRPSSTIAITATSDHAIVSLSNAVPSPSTVLPPLPPTVNAIAPLESLRPVTTNYLPSSTSLSSLPPLGPLPPSLSSLSPTALTRSLLDLTHAHCSVHELRQYASSLHATLTQLTARLDAVTLSRAHSVAHLQREILRKEAVINDLMAERVALLREVDGIRLRAREEVAQEKAALQQNHRRMQSELSSVQRSYAELQHFAAEKAALESALAALRSEVEAERAAHSRDVCELERRNILEKERMKNSMLSKIRATKLSLLAQTEDQLSMITKRTMLENQQVITELMYQSKETERMNAQYVRLVEAEKAAKREAALWRQEKAIMTNKLALYAKLIKQMQDRERDRDREAQAQAKASEEQKEEDATALAKSNIRGRRS